jgi:hypothetical protein
MAVVLAVAVLVVLVVLMVLSIPGVSVAEVPVMQSIWMVPVSSAVGELEPGGSSVARIRIILIQIPI